MPALHEGMLPSTALLARLSAGDFSGELVSDIICFISGKAAAVPPDEELLSFLPTLFQLLHAALLLSVPARPPDNVADGLFAVYRLALDSCLPQSSSNTKLFFRSKALRWISFVQALKEWRRLDEAESEANKAFKIIQAEVEVHPHDSELASRLILLNSFLITSFYKKKPMQVDHYRNIMDLVGEIQIWMSYVDSEMRFEFGSLLATLLGNFLLVMFQNHCSFGSEIIQEFCALTVKVHTFIEHQLYHVVRKIFASFDYNPPHVAILQLIRCCLDLLVCDCKINLRSIANEALRSLCYILRTCFTISGSEKLIKNVQKLLSSYESAFSQVANFSAIFNALFCALFFLDHDQDISHRLRELASFSPFILCIGTGDSSLCLKSHGHINKCSYIIILNLLCHSLYLNAQDPACANADHIQDLFHNFCEILFHFINEMSGLDNYTVVKSYSFLFHLSISTFRFSVENCRHLERSKRLIAFVIKSNWIGDKLQILISELLYMAFRFIGLKEYEKALHCLEMLFIGAWEHASLSNLETDVLETCKLIVFYFNTLRTCDSPNVNSVVVDCLSRLTKDDHHFNEEAMCIVVEGWVQMKCEKNKRDLTKSLYYIVPNSFSKKHIIAILRKELLSYEQKEFRWPLLCMKVEREIIRILTRKLGQDDHNSLERVILLIKEARILRALGIEEIHKCIASLAEAIRILDGKDKNLSIPQRHYSAVAHCLTAMSLYELYPNFAVISAHISLAIKLWSSIRHSNLHDDDPFIAELKNSLPLIYHIADFLSMKGCFDYHFEIYKMIMMINNEGIESCLKSLMSYHRLRHSLCASPIDNGLLDNFWLDCTIEDQSLLVNFVEESLNISPCKEGHAFQLIYADIMGLEAFLAANTLYDNSERLMCNGKLVEAFLMARKALLLRTILLKEKFVYENEVGVSAKNLDDKVGKLQFRMTISTATEHWPSASHGLNLDKPFLSSWKILTCYLESCIQVGSILEKMGNALEALECLRKGHNLSSLLGLNNFLLVFKLMLGKIYGKKKKLNLAISQFDDLRLLRSHEISCIKCQWKLDILLDLEWGLVLCNNNERIAALNLLTKTLKNLSNIEKDPTMIEMSKERLRFSDLLSLKWKYVEKQFGFRLNLIIGELVSTSEEIFENLASAASQISSGKSINMNADRFLYFCELLDKNNVDSIFSLERATLLYEISLFMLKSLTSNPTREFFLIKDNIFKIMTWLLDAFLIACHYPLLFQKVSALLAIIFLFFGEHYPSLLGSKYSWREWSAFFHESSIGPHFYSGKYLYAKHDEITSVRFIPSKIDQFHKCVEDFFTSIPPLSIICMSMIGGEHGKLIRNLLQTKIPVDSWLLCTRFSSEGKPLTVIFPIETLKEMRNRDEERHDDDAANAEKWVSHWDSNSIIHTVVPQYESFRKELFLSGFPPNDPEDNEKLKKRKMRKLNLDKCLGTFLEDIEELWFGRWRCFFEGDMVELDENSENLLAQLKEKYKLDAHEQLVKIILTGNLTFLEKEACLIHVLHEEGTCRGPLLLSGNVSQKERVQRMPSWALDAIKKLELKEVRRHPFILVIDADIQMISWEGLPVMIGQEVYRMPAMGIINLFFKHPSQCYPSVDVSNTYYMINPDANEYIANIKLQIRKLCESQTWKGTIDKQPSIEDLVFELENHDLFIYYGHGRALQFIHEEDIGPLKNCPATMLLSCSGANAWTDGVYRSVCTAFYFVLGRSPFVMANLWEVPANLMDKFGTKLVNHWLDYAMKEAAKCALHTSLTEEKDDSANCTCKKNRTLASFVPAARKDCRLLPYLVGATPVIVGVPALTRKPETRE